MTMRSARVVFVLCALFAAGCGNAESRRVGDSSDAALDAVIANEAGRFLDLAKAEDYAGIAGMVTSSQAKGFDAREFVENRFRMRLGTFTMIGRSGRHIAVTPVEGKDYYLSTAVAVVKVSATNETLAHYVNLYWVKERGAWKILPFPETK